MGLPLFVAPVESDVLQKPTEKSTSDPAYARSPIRRNERRRQLNETQEHRQRLLDAIRDQTERLTGGDQASAIGDRLRESIASESNWYMDLHAEIAADMHRSRLPPSSDRDSPQGRRASEPREGLVLPRIVPGPTASGWTVERDDTPDEPSMPMGSSQPSASRERVALPSFRATRRTYSTQPDPEAARLARIGNYIRSRRSPHSSTRAPATSRTATFGELPLPLPGDLLTGRSRSSGYAAENDYGSPISPPGDHAPRGPMLRDRSGSRPSRRLRRQTRVRYVDGLGDRDRSLSLEGDGVWDTLQSTLTPDPQPPSVGSSFASTTASAAASQSQSAAGSSSTSVTSPDGDIMNENPCDPPLESEESGDELDLWVVDTDSDSRPPRVARRSSQTRRSYADVAADTDDNPAQVESTRTEFLENMRRIVRGLASRDDIPDEWWADAGLSRSILREGSN